MQQTHQSAHSVRPIFRTTKDGRKFANYLKSRQIRILRKIRRDEIVLCRTIFNLHQTWFCAKLLLKTQPHTTPAARYYATVRELTVDLLRGRSCTNLDWSVRMQYSAYQYLRDETYRPKELAADYTYQETINKAFAHMVRALNLDNTSCA